MALVFALVLRVRRLSARNPGPASPVEAFHPRCISIIPPFCIIIQYSTPWFKGQKRWLPFFQKSPTSCGTETGNTRLKFTPYRCILISALPLSLSLSLTLHPIYLLSKTINPRLCLGPSLARVWIGFLSEYALVKLSTRNSSGCRPFSWCFRQDGFACRQPSGGDQ